MKWSIQIKQSSDMSHYATNVTRLIALSSLHVFEAVKVSNNSL